MAKPDGVMARWYLSRQRRCLDGGSIPSRARCNFFAFLTHHTLYGDSIKSMDQWSNRQCLSVSPGLGHGRFTLRSFRAAPRALGSIRHAEKGLPPTWISLQARKPSRSTAFFCSDPLIPILHMLQKKICRKTPRLVFSLNPLADEFQDLSSAPWTKPRPVDQSG